jgi:ATP-dependent RNA helicase DOB1
MHRQDARYHLVLRLSHCGLIYNQTEVGLVSAEGPLRLQAAIFISMELSAEGLAAAAATRETLAAKKRQLEEQLGSKVKEEKKSIPLKKPHLNRPPPACTHEVAIPDGFDPTKIKLDETVHGETMLSWIGFWRYVWATPCFHLTSGSLDNPFHHGTSRAKQYPFVLDPFQETAIACLVRPAEVPA